MSRKLNIKNIEQLEGYIYVDEKDMEDKMKLFVDEGEN